MCLIFLTAHWHVIWSFLSCAIVQFSLSWRPVDSKTFYQELWFLLLLLLSSTIHFLLPSSMDTQTQTRLNNLIHFILRVKFGNRLIVPISNLPICRACFYIKILASSPRFNSLWIQTAQTMNSVTMFTGVHSLSPIQSVKHWLYLI